MAALGTSLERKVVLVVNEEPSLRHLIAAALVDAGFDVIEAADGDECARRTTETPVDLVVLAASASGPNLVRELRRVRPDLKTLMLSDQRALRVDTDAVLHMPFHLDDMREATIALAFGRCRCPACLRRWRRANE